MFRFLMSFHFTSCFHFSLPLSFSLSHKIPFIHSFIHSFLLIRRKSLQILQPHGPQRLFIRRVQKHFRHDAIARRFPAPSLECFKPSTRAQTPFTTRLHPADAPQIVALFRREIEELFRHFGRHRVVPEVARGDFAVAVAQIARHGRGGV